MAALIETKVFYEPGTNITCIATTAIAAGTFVSVTATRAVGANISVGTTGAGLAAFGVALYNAAIGELLGVKPISNGGVVGVTAGSGGVTFGQEVQSDAAGMAVAFSTGKICGMAVNTAAAAALVQVNLGR